MCHLRVQENLSKMATLKNQLLLNAGQKYCRMQYFLPSLNYYNVFVIKVFVLSIFEWPFYTGLLYQQSAVLSYLLHRYYK